MSNADDVTDTCLTCHGEGRIANDDERTPWSFWASLPPGSDLAVKIGLIRPIPCPDCAS